MSAPTAVSLYLGRKFQLMGGAMFRSFRCLWMLEELGVPYDHVPVMPQSRRIKAYNPLGKVPALIETAPSDNADAAKPFVLYESAAINTYLGDLANTALSAQTRSDSSFQRLVPLAGTHERGLYEQTVSCIITELDSQALWIHRKHEAMGQFFGYIPDAVQHAKDHFKIVNRVLATQIHDNPQSNFLVGAHFTAADILYVHCLDWSLAIGWGEDWKKDARLHEYVKVCKERPTYQRVAAIRTQEKEATERMSKL